MNKTESILLQSLPKYEVVLKRLTLIESINLSKKKSGYFSYLKKVVKNISNLDDRQINSITIQDAISLTVFYRMYFWDDAIISDDANLSPSDFINKAPDEESIKQIRIGDYVFTPKILMKDAIDAETYCGSLGDIENLRFYILGAGCTRSGVKDGVNTLLSLMDSSEDVGLLIKYDNMIGDISSIKLTFLGEDAKISLLAEKGGEQYALPFHPSRFFTFGI